MKSAPKTVYFIVAILVFASCKKEHAPDKQEPVPPPPVYGTYFPKVKSIIQTHCTVSCHAPSKGFYDGLPTTLEEDSIISRSAGSIKAATMDPITFTNKRMPPDGPLPDSLTSIIKNWWAKGGKTTD